MGWVMAVELTSLSASWSWARGWRRQYNFCWYFSRMKSFFCSLQKGKQFMRNIRKITEMPPCGKDGSYMCESESILSCSLVFHSQKLFALSLPILCMSCNENMTNALFGQVFILETCLESPVWERVPTLSGPSSKTVPWTMADPAFGECLNREGRRDE